MRVFLAAFFLASFAMAAASQEDSVRVTVSPSQAYSGDPLEISLIGFPADYPVPAGSVVLSGVRLTIPGTFGDLNPRPRTDYLGNVTFTINVPLDVAQGSQTLSVDHFAGGGVKTAEVTILRAAVDFSPVGSSRPPAP